MLKASLALLSVFILLEFGLRFFWQMSGLKGEIYQKSTNSVLRYELKAGARLNIPLYYEGVEINSDGFRGPEYSLKKDKGVYRIVMLGDSVTLARLNKWEDTLTQRLERGLSRLCPGKKFEVLNMGVEGYNSIQELEVLKTKALKYDPDLVIVHYCLNDPDYPEYYFKKNFLNRHSLAVRYILYRLKKHHIKADRSARGIKSDEDAYRYFYGTRCWEDAKEAVLEMRRVAEVRGVKMAVLVVTELSLPVKDFRQGYPFHYIHEKIGRELKGQGVLVIDPLEEFNRLNPEINSLRVWTYPNAKANDIVAEYMIKKLTEARIVLCNQK